MKKFKPVKLWVEKVWPQTNFIDFLAVFDNFKKITWVGAGDTCVSKKMLKTAHCSMKMIHFVLNIRLQTRFINNASVPRW